MPKRVVDGEALWLSDKIKRLPAEYRLHYANWLPLAEANGVFEANAERIHARVYSFMLPSMSPRKVQAIMTAMIEVGLLRVWEENDKTWGYFIGIEKKGRLPGLRELEWYKNLPPNPPLPDDPEEAL
jgi:hypothetical protein